MPTATHMPSVIEINGRAYLLFSQLEKPSMWGSYYCPLDDLSNVTRLKTEPKHSECSPDGFVDSQGQINISITQDYRLVRYRGPSLDELTMTRDYGSCRAGTVLPSEDYVLCGNRSLPVLFYNNGNTVIEALLPARLKIPNSALISRITFVPEDPDKILITGVSTNNDFSLVFSRSMGRVWRITANGQPVYKCTIYHGELFYAVRASHWFEDRYLVRTRNFEFTPV